MAELSGFGKRDKHNNRIRLVLLLILIVIVAVLESSVIGRIGDIERQKLEMSKRNPALKRYLGAPISRFSTQERDTTKTRILYISNSHAKTGGEVSKHLQALLDSFAFGQFEVMDMSEAGIFAPDFLQRTLMGLEMKPDLIILGTAYISFSDRMRLSRQSHNVRSFFKDGVVEKLTIGFWLRHFDLGLYIDTWLTQNFDFIRYRNRLRQAWTRPLASLLKVGNDRRKIFFLEVDVNQSWKFPEGYDNNLFQWRLYSAGRERHLEDFKDLVSASKDAKVPLFILNLPIHWQKSVFPHNASDYREFTRQLKSLSAGVMDFVDYQDSFPKEFTTYDALHPTWFGARLHALDLALRLKKHNFIVDKISYESIFQQYLISEQAGDESYEEQLNGQFPVMSKMGFRRYDLFEPKNARKLLRWHASTAIGSLREKQILVDLSLRLRYWLDSEFDFFTGNTQPEFKKIFARAVKESVKKSKQRLMIFKNQLIQSQNQRLADISLRLPDNLKFRQRKVVNLNSSIKVNVDEYYETTGRQSYIFRSMDGRSIGYGVAGDSAFPDYLRIDLFGDRSFVLLQRLDEPFYIPEWLVYETPYVRFGI